jgi:hypothetical protein
MQLPPGVTEAALVKAIDDAADLLSSKFRFGLNDKDDIKQQGALFVLEALRDGKYDPAKADLAAFIYVHMRNRLVNFKRDEYQRNDPPCKDCHNSLPNHTTHADGRYCQPYERWLQRVSKKLGVVNPHSFDNEVTPDSEQGFQVQGQAEVDAETDEVLRLIDRELDVSLRPAYLQLRAGVKLPKPQRDEVEAVVRAILVRAGVLDDDEQDG